MIEIPKTYKESKSKIRMGKQRSCRRKGFRYSHGNLSVVVKHQGLLGIFRKLHVVDWMDFNQFGMAFLSKHKYNPGDKLTIKLSINNEKKESISGIAGIVRNIRKEYSGNYRCGIEFDFDNNKNMNPVKIRRSLINIELLLNNILLRLTETNITREEKSHTRVV